jgi:two-component system CheB/CheR fusion protein
LRSALHRVFETSQPWLSLPIPVRFNGSANRVLMHVKPADDHHDEADARAVVLFIEGGTFELALEGQSPESDAGNEVIGRLREELQQTQARLRTTREESESANEELRAANEELQSINEEYRSTSEELETSKEELQSINEELQTVNSELNPVPRCRPAHQAIYATGHRAVQHHAERRGPSDRGFRASAGI